MQPQAFTLIEEINTRQDEALRQIDELNERIEHLIQLCVATGKAEKSQFNQETLAFSNSSSDEIALTEIAADSISMHAEPDEESDGEWQIVERWQSKAA